MGESTPRQRPSDAKGAGENQPEATTEPKREPRAKPGPPRSGDPTKEQPQSKFHGNTKKQGPQSKFHG